jgi:hypothetical protein
MTKKLQTPKFATRNIPRQKKSLHILLWRALRTWEDEMSISKFVFSDQATFHLSGYIN